MQNSVQFILIALSNTDVVSADTINICLFEFDLGNIIFFFREFMPPEKGRKKCNHVFHLAKEYECVCKLNNCVHMLI